MQSALAVVALALALVAAPRAAEAQHDHGHHKHGHHGPGGEEEGPRSSFSAAVGVIAATYDAMLFEGDYQGLTASARWSRGRFGAAASIAGYRIDKNGRTVQGLGDLMLHGHAAVLEAGALSAGAVAMVMLPTGDHIAGLGMGHVMLMPGAYARWSLGRVVLGASAGYARGLGDTNIHAEHGGGGAWPLVDPMNTSEVTFGASGMVTVAPSFAAGLRTDGAAAIGDGETRLAGGVRAVWTRGRVETTAELQAGLAGAPFGVRGIVEAAVRFD